MAFALANARSKPFRRNRIFVYRYLFGPVPSRRLGYSLGIDLVPGKTCSFDCVFCQSGKTSVLTLDRREYVPVSEVIGEIGAWIDGGGTADYITLAGSGEPTLNSAFGRVIDAVHSKCRIKTALLSNGTLFYLPEVRSEASKSDLVKVSLSAWDQASFNLVNRPVPSLRFESVLEGLLSFGAEFKGELWLEVFVVQGMNDSEDAMRRIAKIAKNIGPDKIHLNTVVRPPADNMARSVPFSVLEKLAVLFRPVAEVISPFEAGDAAERKSDEESLAGLLARHPCGLKDIAVLLKADVRRTAELLDKMVADGKVRVEKCGNELFYTTVGMD